MIYLASVELVVIAVMAYLLYRLSRDHDESNLRRESRHQQERQELADRIQRPEVLPARPQPTGGNDQPKERDDLHLVGTIQEPKEE